MDIGNMLPIAGNHGAPTPGALTKRQVEFARMADGPITPEPEVVTRGDALAAGLKYYYTGKPCARGHVDYRYVKCGSCVRCRRENANQRRVKNPSAIKAANSAHKQRYHTDPAYREKLKKRSAQWRAENMDRHRQSKRVNYLENKDRIQSENRERWRSYRQDPEWVMRERARKIQEYKDFPERRIASYSARRAREKNAVGRFTTADIHRLLEKQGYTCVYCETDLRQGYEVDHIMPIALGGSNWPSNLQCLCRPCNRRKSSKHPDVFAKEMGRPL